MFRKFHDFFTLRADCARLRLRNLKNSVKTSGRYLCIINWSFNNIIYNGKVDVSAGLWSFDFIVPKDINYQYGSGKLSYYATDSIIGDATGVDEEVIVGGTSPYAAVDLNGPSIQLFMNDTNFEAQPRNLRFPKRNRRIYYIYI